MPVKGIKEPRRFCPYCSGEYAEGYLWLHKRDFCPMRPGRREQLNAEAMELSVPPGIAAAGANVTGAMQGRQGHSSAATPILYQNIIPINLTEEYQNMVKVMQKKKEEEVEIGEEYQCASCNATFHAKKEPKHCPECGIPFA